MQEEGIAQFDGSLIVSHPASQGLILAYATSSHMCGLFTVPVPFEAVKNNKTKQNPMVHMEVHDLMVQITKITTVLIYGSM